MRHAGRNEQCLHESCSGIDPSIHGRLIVDPRLKVEGDSGEVVTFMNMDD